MNDNGMLPPEEAQKKLEEDQLADKPLPVEKKLEEGVEDGNSDLLEAIMVKLQDIDNRLAGLEGSQPVLEEKMKEELDGQPERETGESEKKVDAFTQDGGKPQGVAQIPKTNQPANGKAPGEDLQDKMKVAPQQNALEKPTAGTSEDPTKPKPGATSDNPIPMKMSADEDADDKFKENDDNDEDDKLKESADADEDDKLKEELEEDEDEKQLKEALKKTEAMLKREIRRESRDENMFTRVTHVGANSQVYSEHIKAQKGTEAVKEYLKKLGQTSILTNAN